jgi:hypothetical protein
MAMAMAATTTGEELVGDRQQQEGAQEGRRGHCLLGRLSCLEVRVLTSIRYGDAGDKIVHAKEVGCGDACMYVRQTGRQTDRQAGIGADSYAEVGTLE